MEPLHGNGTGTVLDRAEWVDSLILPRRGALPPPPKREDKAARPSKDVSAAPSKPADRPHKEDAKPRSSGAANGDEGRRERRSGGGGKDVVMKDAEPAARPADKAAPSAEEKLVTRLHVGRLTRNVTEEHVKEIFSTFGNLKVRPALSPEAEDAARPKR